MRERRSETIDGVTFHVQQLPYRRSARLMHKLVGAVGPGILRGLAGVKGDALGAKPGEMLQDMELGTLADGVQALFDRFPAADFDHLVNELFETATIDNAGTEQPLLPVLDDVMAGRHGTMFKAIRFALEVNYGNFFGAFRDAARAARPTKPAEQSKV